MERKTEALATTDTHTQYLVHMSSVRRRAQLPCTTIKPSPTSASLAAWVMNFPICPGLDS